MHFMTTGCCQACNPKGDPRVRLRGAETQPHKHCWHTRFSVTLSRSLPWFTTLLYFRRPRVLLEGTLGVEANEPLS